MNNLIFQEGILLSLPVLFIYILVKFIRKNLKSLEGEIVNSLMIVYLTSFSYFLWFQPGTVFEQQSYNFIPFSTIIFYFNQFRLDYLSFRIIMINLAGNLLITTPIGFWFSYKHFNKKRVLTLAVLIPILFELGQIILHHLNYVTRIIDIDDWLLNSIGILLGYWLTELFKKHFIKKGIN